MIKAALAGLLGAAFLPFVAMAECEPGRIFLRGDWGQAVFSVELADSEAERAQGLMHRESMPKSAGMLFIYPSARHATFWMRNTLIPLDMIFIDAQGAITHVHSQAIPLDETVIDGGGGVTHVLEINGGLAKALGIAVGSQIQHGSIDQNKALWPCR